MSDECDSFDQDTVETKTHLTSLEIEAANRCEATTILIRHGYQIYSAMIDVNGEDIAVRTPDGELLSVQQKSRVVVDKKRYSGKWLLFPGQGMPFQRKWYLVEHDKVWEWMFKKHGNATCWGTRNRDWSAEVSRDFAEYFSAHSLTIDNARFRNDKKSAKKTT